MPRFVLLYHDCPPSLGKPSHWDLMLERDGVLMTWNIPQLPAAWQSATALEQRHAPIEVEATRLPDHRLAYLDYEGPISGDRGHVTRHDHGEYDLLQESAATLRLRLSGQRITATITLPTGQQPNAPA